ncbi:radical SAM family heme chaperone HemW [Roseovarius sp. SCSIO 43702]|uniref:radical SAM family heme chaperone HemW n=1 Tax=Roseovarius sp. SCSIO 43702 TaxID=2823043 RepID=UPI001C7393A3|nr:radical SAM family heme chaperone HemW [Roseovarius sp. SCSIO 43702]QYX58452.1 radical SAM family heme chaperone HemW [Roseovarius sp. SCSIO 43702]
MEDWKNAGFGLYVHWPFCQSKCPYCDFNSHVASHVDQDLWLDAYLAEIERYAKLCPGRLLNSVFFGGGTPSLMEERVVAAILDAAAKHWTIANDLEITLEANPGSVEATRFEGYRNAGVTRVSMGIQALDDHDLRRLGRLHTVDEAMRAFEIARDNFDRVSFDLIYARQDQSLAAWETELSRALSMAVDHLSLYQLTIEPGTVFGERFDRGKLAGLPDEDLSAEMYALTQELCRDAGLAAYEVSNHAAPGAASRHNLIYWRYGDYIGIGPGAHGRLTLSGKRFATIAPREPGSWLKAVKTGSGDEEFAALTQEEQALEYLLMAMRLTEGMDRSRYAALGGDEISPPDIAALEELGMIVTTERKVMATEKGRPVLNSIIRRLAGV